MGVWKKGESTKREKGGRFLEKCEGGASKGTRGETFGAVVPQKNQRGQIRTMKRKKPKYQIRRKGCEA